MVWIGCKGMSLFLSGQVSCQKKVFSCIFSSFPLVCFPVHGVILEIWERVGDIRIKSAWAMQVGRTGHLLRESGNTVNQNQEKSPLLSNAERMSLRCSLSSRCSYWPSLMPNSSKRYCMTWSSDMLQLRSSSYSRHETCSPWGSSEGQGTGSWFVFVLNILILWVGLVFIRWAVGVYTPLSECFLALRAIS